MSYDEVSCISMHQHILFVPSAVLSAACLYSTSVITSTNNWFYNSKHAVVSISNVVKNFMAYIQLVILGSQHSRRVLIVVDNVLNSYNFYYARVTSARKLKFVLICFRSTKLPSFFPHTSSNPPAWIVSTTDTKNEGGKMRKKTFLLPHQCGVVVDVDTEKSSDDDDVRCKSHNLFIKITINQLLFLFQHHTMHAIIKLDWREEEVETVSSEFIARAVVALFKLDSSLHHRWTDVMGKSSCAKHIVRLSLFWLGCLSQQIHERWAWIKSCF